MTNIKILMDNNILFQFNDVVNLTMHHDFKGNSTIQFFAWKETKDSRYLYESRWRIGTDSDVESIIITHQ